MSPPRRPWRRGGFGGWGGGGWDFPPSEPKLPPPADGVKIRKSGTTWWGKRWIAALEGVSPEYASRLARGKTYARAGRTHDLVVRPGEVTARVTGSRPKPYEIRIALEPLDDAAWRTAIAALARQAGFAAELLAGRMPEEIDDAFRDAGARLFPHGERDLQTTCSCPDWANPCKHVAATHYVLGEALDRDPFLLFELRGRTRDQVLDALRAARRGAAAAERGEGKGKDRGRGKATKKPKPAPTPRAATKAKPATATATKPASATATATKPATKPERATPPKPGAATVSMSRVAAADYDRAPAPLPAAHFSLAAPDSPGALLSQLGAPAAWSADESPAELLAPLVHAAAARARRIALAEPDAAPAEPEPARPRRGKVSP